MVYGSIVTAYISECIRKLIYPLSNDNVETYSNLASFVIFPNILALKRAILLA